MSETKNVLRVENVTMQFGGVVAVDDLSMEVNEGEIVALIGPNGAGKTTAFNVITGVYAPTNGQVLFDGKKVVENHPHGKMRRQYKGKHLGDYKSVLEPTPDKLTKMGMARTFQNIRLWKSMTVFDNVLIAKHLRRSSKLKMEVSLDEPLNIDWDGNELLLSDILGTDEDVVSRDIENEAEREMLLAAVSELGPREQEIMQMRFGLCGGKERTQKEVAEAIGISQSYISRLEKKIIRKLRKKLEEADQPLTHTASK